MITENEFLRARLRLTLPELQQKFAAAREQEDMAQWEQEFLRVQTIRDKAAERFAKVPKLIDELIELFRENEAVEKSAQGLMDRLLLASRRLVAPEQKARGLDAFSPAPQDIRHTADWHRVSTEHANLARAPRCGAKTRAGSPCRQAAVTGRARCRMHGGAKGSGGPRGNRNGNFKHGLHTSEKLSRNASHSLHRFQARPHGPPAVPRRPVEVTVSPTVLRALGRASKTPKLIEARCCHL
jgi:hypothetical protein